MKKLMALLIMVGVMMAKTPKKMVVSLKPVVKSATNVNVNADTKSWVPLLTEDFEAGIPGDWQVVDGNGDGYTWVAGTTADLGGNDPPSYGTQYAYYSDDDAGSGSPQTPGEELISPFVDASSYTWIKIKYAWGYNDVGPNDWYKVEYSTDGGSTWNLINEYTIDGSGWDSILVSGSYSDVKVRFVYYETGQTWAWACAADNVSIEGLPPLTHDVGIAAVLPTGTGLPISQEILVTVTNFGTNDESNVPVYVEINGTPFNSPQYVDINAGSSVDVSFGNYNFTEGSYTITAYTALTGDEQPDNDTMTVEYNASWWLQYDDGIYWGAFESAVGNNRGWGMRFDVPAGVQIDSVFVGLTNYPSGGAKPLALVVYGDAGGQPNPDDLLWSKDTSLDAAVAPNWTGHVIYSDNFSVGSNTSIYYFWIDVVAGDGQRLCYDVRVSKPYEYYWKLQNYPSPTFNMDYFASGDWFLRIHINGASGLSEWIPYNPRKEIFLVVKPNIVKNGKVFVNLSVEKKVKIKVDVIDISGKIISTLYKGIIMKNRVITWDTRKVKPGIYFIKVSTPYYIKVSPKVMVVK